MPPADLSRFSPTISTGITSAGALAALSAVTLMLVMSFIARQFVSSRLNLVSYTRHNQGTILIFNLCLAELLRSISITLGNAWLASGRIFPQDPICWVQGALFQLGDLASSLFVFAIAIFTLLTILTKVRTGHIVFSFEVFSIWLFALIMTGAGPLHHGRSYYAPVEEQCWIAPIHPYERLWLHYFWIFVSQAGSFSAYAWLVHHLRTKIQDRSISTLFARSSPATAHITRAARTMLLYPAAHLAASLPLAVDRTILLAGGRPASAFSAVAFCLIAVSGFAHGMLFALTRRVFATTDGGAGSTIPRPVLTNGTASRRDSGTFLYHHNPNVTWRRASLPVFSAVRPDHAGTDSIGKDGEDGIEMEVFAREQVRPDDSAAASSLDDDAGTKVQVEFVEEGRVVEREEQNGAVG